MPPPTLKISKINLMTSQVYIFLKELYHFNCENTSFYYNASLYVRRAFTKIFFERLYLQKDSFCAALKILLLKYQENDENFVFNEVSHKSDSRDFHFLIFNLYRKEILRECYKRELNALTTYSSIIENIEDSQAREILYEHRLQITQVISEMKLTGIDKYLINI